MKKTLIALALLSVSGAAMADVVLYGQIKGGVEVVAGQKSGGAKVDGTVTQIVDYGSRIGFKGQEQLNGDLKAIWQLEQRVDIGGGKDSDGNPRGFGSRNSFIGLEGGFGRVRVGYQHNPIEMAGDLNQWEHYDDAAGLGMMDNGSDVYKRTVGLHYTTPNFNGFKASAFVSPSDNNNGSSGRDAAIYSLGLQYNQPEGGLFAGLAGAYAKNGSRNVEVDNNGKKKDAYQIYTQVGYDAKPWFAGVGYKYSRNVDTDPVTGNGDIYINRSQEVAASFAYTLNDSMKLKASAGYGWDFRSINKTTQATSKTWGNGKYVQGVIGADYLFSKRTEANAQYGYLQAGNSDNRERRHVVSVGLKHRF